MNEKVGEVFSIANDNIPVTGCTISKAVHTGKNDIIYFLCDDYVLRRT